MNDGHIQIKILRQTFVRIVQEAVERINTSMQKTNGIRETFQNVGQDYRGYDENKMCKYLSTLKKSSLYRTLSEAKAKLNLLSEREYRALKMRRKVANSKRLPAKLRVCDRKGSYVAGIEVTSSETSDQDKSDSGLESCNSESTSECMYDSESSLSDGWELELYK